ncbi:PHD finger protein 1 [Bombina bombina]|uniref:PHD finger protein 1 n=1 Tax=Bombina bombina TaxID=8345 RepID=UPI00235B092C|nr:PHD finger protein 1 [Bombina bombina]
MEGREPTSRPSRTTPASPRVTPALVKRPRFQTLARFWEGQDVLARWTDGLLYLGIIKKVDSAQETCLVRFEDNSQFSVLWKDIFPPAVPGKEQLCCVCNSQACTPDNKIVHCVKCKHAYHQECHVPSIPCDSDFAGNTWMCRQCVFAVATKRGGALKKGPYARSMLHMKLSLPYQLKSLEWDPLHLTNKQQCYCYCGGPGEWNMKMLQCCRCLQWFHEACTQCLSKPLLYGDRFYVFECSVCTRGPENAWRLPLGWVDVSHLVLYHLSICCKKKYFDFEREILSFVNENWESLLVGELTDTPRSERYSHLLHALTGEKDRFISGKEIKKKKCLFGLQSRVPPPAPQSSDSKLKFQGTDLRSPTPCVSSLSGRMGALRRPSHRRKKMSTEQRTQKERQKLRRALTQDVVQNPFSSHQEYLGYRGSPYNFRRTGARCLQSPPIRMFASFHPSSNTAGSVTASLQSSEVTSDVPDPPLLSDIVETPSPGPSSASLNTPCLSPPPTSSSPPMETCAWQGSPEQGSRVVARRVTAEGAVQYLVEWGGGGIF